jgi:fimbrial isopeptide formation D2 family protein
VAPNSNDGARCALASVPVDFGDAPSSYSTAIADDGPRHSIINFNINTSTAPLMLGSNVDIEEDGQSTGDADGDDNTHQGTPSVDDERGVTQIVATPGNSDPLTVPVTVANATSTAATLVGWIDLDNDGTFETTERVTANIPAGFNGSQDLTFPAPPAPYSTNTYARFRLFSANDTSPAATGQLPTGPALGGEVEDVRVQVGSYDVSKTSDPADGTTVDPGAVVTYTLTIKNTGSTPLRDLNLDDNLTDVLDDATLQGTPSASPSGTVTVNGNTLQFTGDAGVGETIKVTYAVKVKSSGALSNAVLSNSVVAANSASCDPTVNNGSVTVGDPCKTTHRVGGLANTGMNIFTLLLLSVGLLAAAATSLYLGLHHKKRPQHSR